MRYAAIVSAVLALGYSTPSYPCNWGVSVGVAPLFPHVGGMYAPCAQAAVYVAPPVPQIYVAPPVAQVYVAPPPVYYAPPPAPLYYAPPAPLPPPAAIVQPAAPPPPQERTPRLALKWAPLGWTTLADPAEMNETVKPNAGNVGLELRLNGYWALRSDFEYGQWSRDSIVYGRTWDFLSMKLSLFKNSFLRPYGSAGLTASFLYDHRPDMTVTREPMLGATGALGLDLFLGKHFFIEAEVKGRVYFAPGHAAQGDVLLNQWTGLVGAGVAFL